MNHKQKRNGAQRGAELPSWKKNCTPDDLAAVAQIVVSLVEPVRAGRSENVEIEGILERPGFMRHVGGDTENFAGAHDDLFAIDGELQSAAVRRVRRRVAAQRDRENSQADFAKDVQYAESHR